LNSDNFLLFFRSIKPEQASQPALQFIKKNMSNKIHYSLILLSYSLAANAQSKKWTLKECVNYALENNISVKNKRS
jgi:hypothetical protein